MTQAVVFDSVSKRYQLGGRRSLRETLASLGRSGRRAEDGELSELWALDGVSFAVERGEALAIIGPNGAGKSTILKLVGNIIAPTRGSVSVRGRVASLLELGAGFHPDLTGRQNIYLNGAILGMKRREIDEHFGSIVDFAELHRFMDTPVKRYSSGMYMRLAFAIAVHVDPDILLVDEVLAVGDKAFQEKSLQKAHDMQTAARTVIFVSHNLYAIQSICRQGIFLYQGKIRFVGPVREAVKAYEQFLLERRTEESAEASRPQGGHQWQSNGVRITDVQVRQDGGGEATEVPVGAPVAFRIAYLAERRIERPIIALQIHRTDGLLCAGASTRFDDLDLVAIEGQGGLEVCFDPLLLAPGVYTVSVGIYDLSHTYTYAHWNRTVAFKVVSSGNGLVDSAGIYHLPHRWSIV